MTVWKKQLFKVLIAFGCLTSSFANAAELCECGFVVGAEYLYWSPCVSNMHFAAEGTNPLDSSTNEVNYHFINSDWDSGFRVFLGKEDLFGCFDVMATYTNFNGKHTDCIYDEDGSLSLTWPTPVEVAYDHYATAEWKINFERGELVAGYTIEFGKGCCLALKPFAGVDYTSIRQHRTDAIMDVIPKEAGKNPETPAVVPQLTNTISRSLDYNGIGPMVGMGYSFEICEGLSTFGRASLSLLVGEVDIEETQTFVSLSEVSDDYENEQKYKDNCVCLPGLHLQTGLSYAACVCNKWLILSVGYEYLVWIDAPSHLMYNMDSPGSFTGLNRNSVTLQGFFGGVAFSF